VYRVPTNGELASLHAAGAGFIFNDFMRGSGAERYNVLHAAGCIWVRRVLDGARLSERPTVRKYFFASYGEAQSWLMQERGAEGMQWKRCS
jgi:hypothetical protein